MKSGNNILGLRDIHLPDSILWWPPALGWWLLLAFIVLLLITLWYRKWLKRTSHKKHALALLEKSYQHYQQHRNDQQLATEVSALLRRICISRLTQEKMAGLTGKAWLEFLDTQWVSPNSEMRFSKELSSILTTAPYQAKSNINAEQLINITRSWIKQLPTSNKSIAT